MYILTRGLRIERNIIMIFLIPKVNTSLRSLLNQGRMLLKEIIFIQYMRTKTATNM